MIVGSSLASAASCEQFVSNLLTNRCGTPVGEKRESIKLSFSAMKEKNTTEQT